MNKNAFKIAEGLDIDSIKQHLVANPELFGKYTNRLIPVGPHRESTDIWVRYGDHDKHGDNVFMDEHDSVWYPVLKEIPAVANISFALMALVNGERLGGVLITKIPAGGKIYPHIDIYGWHPNYYDKFYVPIQNKEGAIFGFEDIEIQGEEGSAYWFRNDVPHWVNNDSDVDRIAMVVCIKPFRGVTKDV